MEYYATVLRVKFNFVTNIAAGLRFERKGKEVEFKTQNEDKFLIQKTVELTLST